LSDSAGFTLVELMIVVTIIGIISSIGTVLYSNFIQKTRETSVIVYLRYINKAQTEYRFFDDGYTREFEDLEKTGSLPKKYNNNITEVGDQQRILENYLITLQKQQGEWFARAEPVDLSTDRRWFYIDETGVARFEQGKTANATSPKL